MEHSELLARLIGPLLVVIAAAVLFNRSLFEKMADQFAENYAVIFLTGMIIFVAGLAIVEVHNIWVGNWRVLITLVGWLSVLGGAFRMIFPETVADIREGFARNRVLTTIGGLVNLALGAFLTVMGYGTL